MAKEMNFLNIGNNKFEVADALARGQINNFIEDHNTDAAETVLWTGSIHTSGDTVTIDKLLTDYDYIEVRMDYGRIFRFNPTMAVWELDLASASLFFESESWELSQNTHDSDASIPEGSTRLDLYITKIKWNGDADTDATITSDATATLGSILKIVGIKNVTNAELEDLRVGVDGTVYPSAGEAVRTQILQAMSSGSGLTADVKQALLNCFEHVAWTDEHGQQYVDALEAALYPPANLVSISAVYTQSGTVYDTDSLDDLKDDLVVTAHYDDGTSETITNYTLSGTLAIGTSTITVSYGGKTANFTVTVTEYPSYSITYNLTNVTSSNNAVKVAQGGSYTTTLSYDDTQYVLPLPTITMGGVDVTANYYDSESRTLTINNVTGNIVITAAATGLTEITLLECGIANTNGGMKVYSDNEQTQIANPSVYGYGALRIAPVIFAQDTTIRVTFTNETESTMNKGNIYLGSLDPFYKANQTQYSNIYAISTTANLVAGASVTREFTVKAGHYPVIEYGVNGQSKYTITALAYGEPKTITTVKEWVCNARPGTITWYASSDGSGDGNTITNYPYISYAPVPANAGNAVVCVSHRNEETLITADIASGDFSGASGATSSAITAYNWATFNETLRIIGNLPMFMNITKYQGMQKLFRGTNSNTAFNSIKEVTL